jgi:hypothetical protein
MQLQMSPLLSLIEDDDDGDMTTADALSQLWKAEWLKDKAAWLEKEKQWRREKMLAWPTVAIMVVLAMVELWL